MPFASPFGSITTPSFNPSYSNVPQNKPPKAASVPQNKPPTSSALPESPASSVEELNSGITPHIFVPPSAQQFNAMPMQPPTPPMPMAMPQQFNPYAAYLSQVAPAGIAQRVETPQLPQRLNPNRPIFV